MLAGKPVPCWLPRDRLKLVKGGQIADISEDESDNNEVTQHMDSSDSDDDRKRYNLRPRMRRPDYRDR